MEVHGNRELTYLYAGGTPFAIHQKQGQTEQLFYLHLDYQGSIRAITNEQGIVVEIRDYDAWGRPRNPVTLNYTAANPFTHSLNTAIITSRGYTFHEHIFEFSLINMKVPSKQVQSHACMSYAEREVLRGEASTRLYDPYIGRMLSPDNLVVDPYNVQHYNRYSYVWNNPLAWIDPTGNSGGRPDGKGGVIFDEVVIHAKRTAPPPPNNEYDMYLWRNHLMSIANMYPAGGTVSGGSNSGHFGGGPGKGGQSNSGRGIPVTDGFIIYSIDEVVISSTRTTNSTTNAQGGEGGGFNQEDVDFAGAVGGGLTTVFEAASHYSDFVKAAGKIGVVGNVITGATYGHALVTGQAKPAHHLDAAVAGTLLILALNPATAPFAITAGFIYGGSRLIGGEAFDNWFNNQFAPSPILTPNK